MADTFDAKAALDKLIKKASSWGAAEVGFAKGSFYHRESEWRAESRAFDEWLAGDDQKRDGAVKEIGRSCGRSELIDLNMALKAISRDKPDLLEALRNRLREVRKHSRAEYDIDTRVKDTACLREILERIEDAADDKVRSSLSKKWPIVSSCLANAAPEHFVFVRPMTVTHKELQATLFAGIEYKPGADPELYGKYLTRSEQIRKAMSELERVGPPPPSQGLRSVSEWWTAFSNLESHDQTMRELRKLLEHGHHVILQGPPGTGKTHHAERLAKDFAEKLEGEVKELVHFDPRAADGVAVVKHFVQFHASYDYEDFVRGFRPVVSSEGAVGFELRDGPFAQMVSFALRFPQIRFLLVIDEINRADLARVLGECIYLLDRRCWHTPEQGTDHRGVAEVWSGKQPGAVAVRYQPQAPRPGFEHYAGESTPLPRLCLPDNIFIVGTMNTADRSIAIVDVALRRRFAFMEVQPDPRIVWKNWGNQDKSTFDQVEGWMTLLNGEAEAEGEAADPLIRDARYHIGHAYFMKRTIDELKSSVLYQVVPLLEEYRGDGVLAGATPEEVDELLGEMRSFGRS